MDEHKYIVHTNFDTTPKLLGIFSYSNIVISACIAIPTLLIITKLNLKVNIKIYACFFILFPTFIFNLVFASYNNIFSTILYIIKYYLSERIFVYNKSPTSPIISEIGTKFKNN